MPQIKAGNQDNLLHKFNKGKITVDIFYKTASRCK